MKVGEGFAVVDVDSGDVGETLSVCKLEDGYVQVMVTNIVEHRAIRAIIHADQARALAKALNDAAKEDP